MMYRACVPCATYLRPRKNGIVVLETFEDGEKPYKIWMADLFECPKCGHQMIDGFGAEAWGEHYEADFADKLKEVTHTIRGCPLPLPGEMM